MGVQNGASLALTAVAHTTAEHATTAAALREQLGKEVLSSHAAVATTASATLETGLAILVVDLSLAAVGKNFVSVRDFLELFLGSGVVCVLVCACVSLASSCRCCFAQGGLRIPGWYLRAPILYAFFSSASVAVGET